MYAFRRIKIEVNIGSTTIVSLDPFPFPRIDLPFPSPVLCTMKPRSIDEPNVRTWGRYYLSVMMARVHESMKRETKEGGKGGVGEEHSQENVTGQKRTIALSLHSRSDKLVQSLWISY